MDSIMPQPAYEDLIQLQIFQFKNSFRIYPTYVGSRRAIREISNKVQGLVQSVR